MMEKLCDIHITGDDMDYFHYVSPTAYQRFAEKANFYAARAVGLDMHQMIRDMNVTWMTASTYLEVYSDLSTTGPAEIYAPPLEVNGLLLTQRMEVRRDNVLVVRGEINTLSVDINTRKVVRPETVLTHYGIQIVRGTGSMARLTAPEGMTLWDTIPVRYSDCDMNQHLRAYKYTDFVCDAAEYWSGPEAKKLRHLYIEYSGECRPGEQLSLYRKITGKDTFVSGMREDGKNSFKAYFVVE